VQKPIKFLSQLLLLLLPLLFCANTIVHAEVKTIVTEGIAHVGENETELQAKHRAWLDAQRLALEEAGVVLASTTTVVNLEVVEDWIQTKSLARMQTKLLSESRSFEESQLVIRVTLACTLDSEDVALFNQELQNLAGAAKTKNTAGKPGGILPASPVESVKDFALPDGSLYTGSIIAGLPDGRGVKTYPDGSKYEGAFRKGYREGSGTMLWANGDRYTGHWLRDLRSGRGEFTSFHDEKQVGRWLNDLYYGE
jgi:hypothetical protein